MRLYTVLLYTISRMREVLTVRIHFKKFLLILCKVNLEQCALGFVALADLSGDELKTQQEGVAEQNEQNSGAAVKAHLALADEFHVQKERRPVTIAAKWSALKPLVKIRCQEPVRNRSSGTNMVDWNLKIGRAHV